VSGEELPPTGSLFLPGPATGALPIEDPFPPTGAVPVPGRPRRSATAKADPPPADATRGIPLRGATNRRSGKRLRVDWPACKAHGLCHELLPEAVGLDEWGFPVIAPKALRGARLDDAKRAVAACPTLALRLVDPT
jgi:ferredoxin